MDRGQVSGEAAEVYEEVFVPAVAAEWAGRLVQAAALGAGERVLDVGCGTGVVARVAAGRVGARGTVVGLDPNAGMLAVARDRTARPSAAWHQAAAPEPEGAATTAPVAWLQAPAESLPVADRRFDAVVSQFALTFFDDPAAALAEMLRVLRPGGRLAVAVWDLLPNSPGYAALAEILQRLFGEAAAETLRTPCTLGDVARLRALFARAGLPEVTVTTLPGTAHFPSLEALLQAEIRGWVLAEALDPEQYRQLEQTARQALQPFVHPDGSVRFATPAHIATARKA